MTGVGHRACSDRGNLSGLHVLIVKDSLVRARKEYVARVEIGTSIPLSEVEHPGQIGSAVRR